MAFLTVGQAAEMVGVPPKKLSDALYMRRLDVSRCPLIGGRRMIPPEYVATIKRHFDALPK
jgi:hypothetical protein